MTIDQAAMTIFWGIIGVVLFVLAAKVQGAVPVGHSAHDPVKFICTCTKFVGGLMAIGGLLALVVVIGKAFGLGG